MNIEDTINKNDNTPEMQDDEVVTMSAKQVANQRFIDLQNGITKGGESRVTMKQKRFVNEVVRGKSTKDAYLSAYDTDNHASARVNGSILIKQEKIQKLLNDSSEDAFLTLKELLKTSQSDNVRVKIALEILDRSGHGAIKKSQSVQTTVNIDSLLTDLESED